MSHRSCSLETQVLEMKPRAPESQDEELGGALRDAVLATQANIDKAFGQRHRFRARLKNA